MHEWDKFTVYSVTVTQATSKSSLQCAGGGQLHSLSHSLSHSVTFLFFLSLSLSRLSSSLCYFDLLCIKTNDWSLAIITSCIMKWKLSIHEKLWRLHFFLALFFFSASVRQKWMPFSRSGRLLYSLFFSLRSRLISDCEIGCKRPISSSPRPPQAFPWSPGDRIKRQRALIPSLYCVVVASSCGDLLSLSFSLPPPMK